MATRITDASVAERREYRCYIDGEILYVPHYAKNGIFVSPWKTEHTELELIAMGAKAKKNLLYVTNARNREAEIKNGMVMPVL